MGRWDTRSAWWNRVWHILKSGLEIGLQAGRPAGLTLAAFWPPSDSGASAWSGVAATGVARFQNGYQVGFLGLDTKKPGGQPRG